MPGDKPALRTSVSNAPEAETRFPRRPAQGGRGMAADRTGEQTGLTNGVLLAGRLLLAASLLPPAIPRALNISGFAATLTMKGVPYGDVAATLIVLSLVFGPLALVLGLAPRLTAATLIGATLVGMGTLHRFWDYGGLTRQVEQDIFLGQLGILAGLLLYALAGPGAWSWQAWWRSLGTQARPASKRKKPAGSGTPKPRAPKPRPAPARPAADDDLADAA